MGYLSVNSNQCWCSAKFVSLTSQSTCLLWWYSIMLSITQSYSLDLGCLLGCSIFDWIRWCTNLHHQPAALWLAATRLGPLSFLVLIDDLEVGCLVHKFVDDTTLTELLDNRTKQSNMQSCFDRLLTWSDENDMVVNFNKTKELVMGPPSLTSNLPLINTTTGHIERVNSTKLLGLYLDSNLTWHTHT